MPHIGVVMERSLHGERSVGSAFVDLVARSVVAGLGKRQSVGGIQGTITDATTAFSSWENCMAATFCKWPVIGVIIFAGLIVLSIVWCCARCLCCGLSCCCECCYCLKCCGNCFGMCDPPKGKRHKHLDDQYGPPSHNQGYQPHADMTAGFGPPPSKPVPPQYAEFDMKKDADSLPAMPTWDDGGSKKVYLEEDTVEMTPLKKPEASQSSHMQSANASTAAMGSPVTPGVPSPYGPLNGQGGANGYMAASQTNVDPYAGIEQGYDNYYDNNRGQTSQDNMNQGYGVAAAASMGQGRRTPHQDYNTGYDQGYPQSRTPGQYNDGVAQGGAPGAYGAGQGRQSPAVRNAYGSPPPGTQAGYGGYGNASRRPSPGPNAAYGYGQRSNTPGSYGRQYSVDSQQPYAPAPQRQFSTDSYQQYPSTPGRQYTRDTEQPYTSPQLGYGPTSPIRNGGFDFNSSHSRPSSPPSQTTANGGKAYPGYRPYKPVQDQRQQNEWSVI